ncbi:NAD(P)H-hydrate dehydratase [Noviherbaspirillum saxi]|uniref:Bifunctional NAD(P)H-hydrate repair enzyme n=1 Tax=Noviherbaspirillum saxi TaxID=2320863 RepID=A0A3A3FWD0_9BURK|nr:NAD(P)H-hydrate dehydratase [Noviherbaspirillum saxi]RJF98461.1 NAD(P)H-hydrate dehydratase [Noviherbaspirillum saxi]
MHDPTALYTVDEVRNIERDTMSALPPGTLMQRAAKAATTLALSLLQLQPAAAKVLLVAGPGNNGGDALVMACLLADAGLHPTVMVCADPSRQPEDAQRALERAQAVGIRLIAPNADAIRHPVDWDLVVDGLFGIGLARPITDSLRTLVEAINALPCPVLALDVPSGLDADTGTVVGGADGIAIVATHTLTFIGNKAGLHTSEGRDHAGEVRVAGLDIDLMPFGPSTARLGGIHLFSTNLRKRRHSSHKGSYGDVTVIGGGRGMAGAPVLSSHAAAKCGAGRVFTAFVDQTPAYDFLQPELMCRHVVEIETFTGVLVVGPGLGTSQQAKEVLEKALLSDCPLVLDADALNLLSVDETLQQALRKRSAPSMLTPHPLEAARLLQTDTRSVQADRMNSARRLAQQTNAVVVLKGSGSIVARADGALVINPTGNPALATAGSGDVLAGICGALLAQTFPCWEAALAAVWVHGAAADALVRDGVGPIGLTASELIPAARRILNQLTEQHAQRHVPR